jgi:hypothetical protein
MMMSREYEITFVVRAVVVRMVENVVVPSVEMVIVLRTETVEGGRLE